MANPTLLDMPIARDGNKNTIPTTDNGTTGLLSQQYGWQLINAIPPQQGGKAVKREDFNGALYLLSNLLFYTQKGWQFLFDENQDYYAGCIVRDPSDSKLYMAKNDVPASSTEPHSDSTNWQVYDLSAYLLLSGGHMKGSPVIDLADDSKAMVIAGGTMANCGSFVQLNGRTSNPINGPALTLSAYSDQNDDQYVMRINGRTGALEYGKYISGYPYNDLGGSAIVAKSIGTEASYIKTASGEIRQWLYKEVPANTTSLTVTFPITFPNWYSVICTMGAVSSDVGATYVSNSQFTAAFSSYIGTRHLNVIAIGY